MTFLYIHGFNSDGDGWKAQALRRQFPESQVIAPDLPANPLEVMQLLGRVVTTSTAPIQLIGTSLGGFYAYCLSAQFQLPAWLFNPSLEPYKTLNDRGIGDFKTWTKQRDYRFKADYLAPLQLLRSQADYEVQVESLRFFLADDDDILDHSSLAQQFPKADIRWFSGAGHGFSKFEKVLKLAKKEAWNSF